MFIAPDLGQSRFSWPFCPHPKHCTLLMSRPRPEREDSLPKFISSSTALEVPFNASAPMLERAFRASRLSAFISRFVSRISAAVGSSESSSSDDASVSPSECSVFSNATEFCSHVSLWSVSAKTFLSHVCFHLLQTASKLHPHWFCFFFRVRLIASVYLCEPNLSDIH